MFIRLIKIMTLVVFLFHSFIGVTVVCLCLVSEPAYSGVCLEMLEEAAYCRNPATGTCLLREEYSIGLQASFYYKVTSTS